MPIEHCPLYLTHHYSGMTVEGLVVAGWKARLIVWEEGYLDSEEGAESELEPAPICHRSLEAVRFDDPAALIERRLFL